MKACLLVLVSFCLAFPASAQLVISEFMARNATGLKDEDADLADWIELSNPSAAAVSTLGWSITDSTDRPKKWPLPEASIPAGGRVVIFASNKDRRAELGKWHTNFELSAPGEYLALTGPDGKPRSEFPLYPPQLTDRAYGAAPSGQIGYLTTPSPGASNGELVMDGPMISNVVASPADPGPGQDITVSAQVVKRLGSLGKITLVARFMYRPAIELPMKDDGSGGDLKAGDGTFTTVIRGQGDTGPNYVGEEMIRWAVLAEDEAGRKSREPSFLDSTGIDQSPEFFGVVAKEKTPGAVTLPFWDWFTEKEAASRTRAGTRASLYYLGRFYDNVFVRQRGGATNGSSQKFEFNNAWPGYLGQEAAAVGEVNLNANGSDPSYLRQPLAFETFRAMGSAACLSRLVVMNVNTKRGRVGVLVEQVDEDFLSRNGFDPNGELYKMTQRSNLNPVFADTTTGVTKKTGYKPKDLTNFKKVVDGLKLSGEDRRKFLMDTLNVPQILNYCAVRSIVMDADDVRKNFYFYQDTRGTGEWSIFPWDKDWTFGVEGDGAPFLRHPFFGDNKHAKSNANQWNMLYEAVFTDPVLSQMYLRRLRSLVDEFLQPASTPEAERYFEQRVQALSVEAQLELPAAAKSASAAIKTYLTSRRCDYYQTYSGPSPKEALLPEAQDLSGTDLSGAIGAIEFSPASGNQDEEFIEITNPSAFAIDISGWTLDGAIRFTFPPGTVIPGASQATAKVYVTPNAAVFRARKTSPKGGEGIFVVGSYQGHLSNFGETLILKNTKAVVIAQKSFQGQTTELERFLFVSEIMYHPKPPDDDAEYVELVNLSDNVTLDLTGVKFTRGIEFAFPAGTKLAPRAYALIVKSGKEMERVYGLGLPILGEFSGNSSLSNQGEGLKIEDGQGRSLVEFSYKDGEKWPLADGDGPSLVVVGSGRANLDDAASWRASAGQGSPGKAETTAAGFVGDPLADADGDGLRALLEYALGTSDRDPAQGLTAVALQRLPLSPPEITITVPAPPADVVLSLESSNDLRAWGGDQTLKKESLSIAGRSAIRWSGVFGEKLFYRLYAELKK